jgi:hypothetical protein
MKNKTLWAVLGFIAILAIVCNIYYSEQIHFWPQGIHEWAQADRLSLALNFYDHGMDFFHPRTNNLYSADGITGVELPLQSYIAALCGKVIGRGHISACFRLLDILITCTGLVFLFMACYKRTKDLLFSMFTPLFMFMTPILIYYTCNYIPDSAACSLAFISFYFILGYIDTNSTRKLVWAVAVLTLAALIKTSVGLYLMGFLGFVFLQRIANIKGFSKKQNLFFVLSGICSFAAILAQYTYNQYLNTKYHSTVFLARPNPFENWERVRNYFEGNFKHVWSREYMLLSQYPLYVALVVVGIMLLLRSTTGKKQLRLLLLFFLGTVAVGYIMGGQLPMHDYYAVSMFLPLWGFGLLISVIGIRQYIAQADALKIIRTGLLSALVICFFFADYHSHQRLLLGYIGLSPYEPLWFVGGEKVLEELHVPADERIVMIYEDAPNTGLIYFNRRGYSMPPKRMRDGNWLRAFVKKTKAYTVVFDTAWQPNIMMGDEAFKRYFEEVGVRGRISVWQLKEAHTL